MFTGLIRSLLGDEQGSALVEASILMPVLFMLLLGVYEVSWYFYNQHMVSTGVSDGARYLARAADPTQGDPCTQPPPADNTCTLGTFKACAQNLAVTGSISGGSPRVTGWTSESVTIACPAYDNSANTYQGGATIYSVTVSTTFADPALGFLAIVGLGSPQLSLSHTERSIGPG